MDNNTLLFFQDHLVSQHLDFILKKSCLEEEYPSVRWPSSHFLESVVVFISTNLTLSNTPQDSKNSMCQRKTMKQTIHQNDLPTHHDVLYRQKPEEQHLGLLDCQTKGMTSMDKVMPLWDSLCDCKCTK